MNEDQVEGKAKQAEGEAQEKWGDAKQKADDALDAAEDKLDDLGDKIDDIKDKVDRDEKPEEQRRRTAADRLTKPRTGAVAHEDREDLREAQGTRDPPRDRR